MLFGLPESEHGNPRPSLIVVLTSNHAGQALFRCGAMVTPSALMSQHFVKLQRAPRLLFAPRTVSTVFSTSRPIHQYPQFVLTVHDFQYRP